MRRSIMVYYSSFVRNFRGRGAVREGIVRQPHARSGARIESVEAEGLAPRLGQPRLLQIAPICGQGANYTDTAERMFDELALRLTRARPDWIAED